MSGEWVILLEAARPVTGREIGAGEVEALFRALCPEARRGGVLHCPDRYALQVMATASSPVEALVGVLSRWTDAVHQLGLPVWEMVRSEVFTPEELELEFQSAQQEQVGVPFRRQVDSDSDDIAHHLLQQAFSDPLTGLLSPAAFAHRVDAALIAAGAEHTVCVVCLDLDGFGRINDLLGGVTGDRILIAVAQLLSATVRPGDALARLGADEYAVVLKDTTAESAVAIADRMVDSLHRPFEVDGQELTLSASAGVAASRADEAAETLVGNAQAALCRAKTAGGGRSVLFGADAPPRAQVDRYSG